MGEPDVSVKVESEEMTVVSLVGEHDLSSSDRVRDALDAAAESPTTVLDLTAAEFVDSSILGVIVSAYQQAQASGRRFLVVVGSEPATSIRRILDLTGLSALLQVSETREQALEPDRERQAGSG
ncbi:MAG: anti-sigma factor antagonist [Gaiellales bacterium]